MIGGSEFDEGIGLDQSFNLLNFELETLNSQNSNPGYQHGPHIPSDHHRLLSKYTHQSGAKYLVSEWIHADSFEGVEGFTSRTTSLDFVFAVNHNSTLGVEFVSDAAPRINDKQHGLAFHELALVLYYSFIICWHLFTIILNFNFYSNQCYISISCSNEFYQVIDITPNLMITIVSLYKWSILIQRTFSPQTT